MMKRVLLVEDNPHNRKIFSGMLTHSGFEVVEAEDGHQAIAAMAKQLPDIVLMDLSIPGIDGWEVTRRFKADARTKAVPIIALTAHAMRGDEERARAAGCDHYLAKPVSPKKVVEEVRRFLPK
ncbi:MAG TPA: response regulator [Polyangia bacterium]|jgi:two-component system cell cycle response regulator DivK|nr:response regulator [Polyangia bacterium]